MKIFRRRRCALCGAKPVIRTIHGREVNAPHRKVWVCMVYCRKCSGGVSKAALDKETAKAIAVRAWNKKEADYMARMKRLLNEIFKEDTHE